MPPAMSETAIEAPSGDQAGCVRAVTPSTASRRSLRLVSTFQMVSSLSPSATRLSPAPAAWDLRVGADSQQREPGSFAPPPPVAPGTAAPERRPGRHSPDRYRDACACRRRSHIFCWLVPGGTAYGSLGSSNRFRTG